MYHVFTGRLPFKASDLASLLTANVTKTPRRPRTLNPMLPVTLEKTICKAMHRDPSKRHVSCTQLGRELTAISKLLRGK